MISLDSRHGDSVQVMKKAKDIEKELKSLGIPYDAAVYGRFHSIYDATLDVNDPRLKNHEWYAMNHSSKPNVKMVPKYNNVSQLVAIEWRALRRIGKFEPLTYDYGVVPKSWR